MSMNSTHFSFLTAVLGTDGAMALQKASDRSEDLGNALVPRAILSWLDVAGRFDYEGEIPGIDGSFVSFSKSETGFNGSIDLHGELHKFNSASIFHLAASVATAIDINDDILPSGIRNSDILKLAKSIDLLAKSKLLSKAMSYADAMNKVDAEDKYHDKDSCFNIDCINKDCVELKKNKDSHHGAPSKGAAAGQIKPAMPIPPTSVAPQQPQTTSKVPKLPGSAQAPTEAIKPLTPAKPKVAKSMTITLTKAEAERGCPLCGKAQFVENEFKGCVCLSALSKNVAVANVDEHGFILKLNEDWGKDEVLTLFECVGRINNG